MLARKKSILLLEVKKHVKILHDFIKVKILQHISSCMFRPSLAHYQGAHNCTKQFLDIFCM